VTDWPVRKLKDVVELRRGFDLPHGQRRDGPYPVLTAGATAGWHDEGPVEGPGFVIGRATNLGQPTWSSENFWPLNTTLYAADFMGNEPKWLYHLFETLDLSGYDSGSVQPMLNRNYIASVPVAVPPLPEQRAIAEVLGALDEKTVANTRLAQLTEELLESEVEARWLCRDGGHGVDSVPIIDLLEINPKIRQPSDEDPIYLDMRKLPEVGSGINEWENRPARSGARFMQGDTLMARITPCLENRKTGYVDFLQAGQVGVGSTEFIVLRSRAGIASPISYFIAVNEEFRDFAIRHMVGTSGRQRVSAADLSMYRLPAPERAWLGDFGRRAELQFTLLKSLRQENRTLAATRGALLPRLMSGKLRVKDAEIVVEGLL
jgi:type I restriction enzyme S subunit